MNKLVNPLPSGGFPLENEDLVQQQVQLYTSIFKLYESVGANYIVTGCVVTASDAAAQTCTVSGGWVFIDGELRLFPGYTGAYPFYAKAATPVYTTKRFFDGTVQNAYIDLRCQLVTTQPPSGGYITFNPGNDTARVIPLITADVAASLATEVKVRGNAITNLQNQVTTLQNEVKLPVGGIILWNSQTIPAGYGICDGTQGTPDLRAQFVVGADPRNADYVLGAQGGEEKHVLSVAEMPAHTHDANFRITDSGADLPFRAARQSANGASGTEITTQSAGGGTAHENRPPYYALYFIQRLR